MEAVEKCLEELIDKGYIQKSAGDMYEYLP
jgi:hypothetical protein